MDWVFVLLAVFVLVLIVVVFVFQQRRKSKSIEWNQQLLDKAQSSLAENNEPQAKTYYQKIVANLSHATSPSNAPDHNILGYAYIGLGQIAARNHQSPEALDHYRKAIAVGNVPAEILSEVAISDARNGSFSAEAQRIYSLYFDTHKPSLAESDPVLNYRYPCSCTKPDRPCHCCVNTGGGAGHFVSGSHSRRHDDSPTRAGSQSHHALCH